ncbi:MAG: crossover junction endodeoxyribonuclease RuvC [Deltaproteobacteria bacterium]|nr:crossover junction endodeoxyribonuclease RuvC [Deltaproteobacteria bacterium]
MLILGIDPGSSTTGFGLVDGRGTDLRYVHHAEVKVAAGKTLAGKLACLYQATLDLLDEYQPEMAAVEGIFYGRNVRSMLVLGQARGAALVAVANRGLEIAEYPPTVVKQSVVGYGRAAKEQVQQMVKVLLNRRRIGGEHAADALAVAICHHQHRQLRSWQQAAGRQ